ncbi:DUF3231 family protein [Neobacillus sp. PS3-34]|uniref:DUF3231 family protein n=1 Tax=Neobacillus sp. PS3-34 TaxID=3070678 RepID=UPI0027E04C8D|nr:DUF3231 family protein [Neobacillus sp. PS3-34]WML50068.1 DUF3231 family protein [Neobacillus sp. PS3-34]
MEHSTKLTSSEIGTLWISFIESTMQICIYKYFVQSIEDEELRALVNEDLTFTEEFVQTISSIFQKEGIALPIGFTDQDVNEHVPKLLADGLILYYLQTLSKGGMNKDATVLALTSRKDLKNLFKKHLDHNYSVYERAEDILLERGLYIRPPYVPLPNETEFVSGNNYLGGIPILGEKRPLNTIEISHLFMNINVNIIGMMLCTAFSQVANDQEVTKHLLIGKQVSKDIIDTCSRILIDSDVQAPTTWDVEVTDSTVSPFSDKLMLSFINMLSAYGFGIYAVSSAASLRTDLQVKYANISKDVAAYTKDGIELMIKKGWFEQPPTLPDRNKLANS